MRYISILSIAGTMMISCNQNKSVEHLQLNILSIASSKFEYENKIIEFEIKNNTGKPIYIASFDSLVSHIQSTVVKNSNGLTLIIPDLENISRHDNPPSEGSFPMILATDSADNLVKYYQNITLTNNKFKELDNNGKKIYKIPSYGVIKVNTICVFFPDELANIDSDKVISEKTFPIISINIKVYDPSSETYAEEVLVSVPNKKLNSIFLKTVTFF